jgi:peptide methionine sulfoxide reductase msrA/msrB
MLKIVISIIIIATIIATIGIKGTSMDSKPDKNKWSKEINKLTPEEQYVLIDKGTERPFTGVLLDNKDVGIYKCKLCGTPLFSSTNKFESHCGWPSFDDAISGAVKEVPDIDGRRVEIVCAKCGGHLGHVFRGEGMTVKNTRHCVNSLSLNFEKQNLQKVEPFTTGIKYAYFAGGCFWGVEHLLQKIDGVSDVQSGYMGGKTENPTYKEICNGGTGHIEAVKVTYDASKVSYEALAKAFFEIHDPTQKGRQGPDVGSQYISAIFVDDEDEKATIDKLVGILESKGYDIATKILPMAHFYPAEDYHQDYYVKHGKEPYCHVHIKRF